MAGTGAPAENCATPAVVELCAALEELEEPETGTAPELLLGLPLAAIVLLDAPLGLAFALAGAALALALAPLVVEQETLVVSVGWIVVYWSPLPCVTVVPLSVTAV